jgi:hypothetical protein
VKRLYTHVEEPAPIICYFPYTKVTARAQMVVDCIRAQRVQPIPVKVGNDDRYWNLIREAWATGDTFFIVEQDVIPWQGALHQMDECDQGWCTLPTMCHGRFITTTLGCVKFGASEIERRPGFWDDIEPTWYHLDAGFSDKIGWPFIKPHAHVPAAIHLNEVQWPDEISVRYALERKIVWQSMEAGQAVVKVKSRAGNEPRRGGSNHVVDGTIEADKLVGYDTPET